LVLYCRLLVESVITFDTVKKELGYRYRFLFSAQNVQLGIDEQAVSKLKVMKYRNERMNERTDMNV